MIMSIASQAMAMKQSQVQNEVGVKTTKMAIDQVKQEGEALNKLLASTHPTLGNKIDVRA